MQYYDNNKLHVVGVNTVTLLHCYGYVYGDYV